VLSNQVCVLVRAALAIAAAPLVARVWFLAHRALDLDEFEHAHAAWSVARGLLPYRDFFEHHPPAFYLLFAPLFAAPDIPTDAAAAVRALMRARAAMWLTMVLAVAIAYRLGTLVRSRRGRPDHAAGAFAVALLATSSQFLESMLEFRPDVPAVLCLLVAVWCLAGVGPDTSTRSRARVLIAGAAFGAALLFTQKTIFAAPGLGLALLARRRLAPVALFAIGALLPIAGVVWWFNRHDALAPLWYYTVTFNGRLNADRLSPFPRMLSNIVQQPAIYLLGVLAIVVRLTAVRLKPDAADANSRRAKASAERQRISAPFDSGASVITFTALSLVAGIFIIGRAYDQYYALLLPLFAALGGALAADLLDRFERRRAVAVASGVMLALALFSLVISARAFTPIDPQLDDIAFVTSRTTPSDTYVGGTPGPALFRPSGWFYFFMTGAFATAGDYAELLSALEAGRLRPTLMIRDRSLEEHAPAALLAFIAAHYRQVRRGLYLRQSEYGSSTLNTSEASERLDRPLTR
jgi:Dolichyl-phosphate-mannose-protein mannosyltransferase